MSGTTRLGVTELLLSVHYVDVPDFTESSSDDLKRAAARFQWRDWRKLRLTEVSSDAHRTGVHEMAERLVAASQIVSARPVRTADPETERAAKFTEAKEAFPAAAESDSDEPGLIDLIADAEETFPEWNATVVRMTEIMETVSELMVAATEEMNRADALGRPSSAKVAIIHKLAMDLRGPASDFAGLGARYAGQVLAVDGGIRAIIELAEESDDSSEREQACELFASIRQLASVSAENAGVLQSQMDILASIARLSRDMRSPVSRLQDALRNVIDAQVTIDGWVDRIASSSIDCPGPVATGGQHDPPNPAETRGSPGGLRIA